MDFREIEELNLQDLRILRMWKNENEEFLPGGV